MIVNKDRHERLSEEQVRSLVLTHIKDRPQLYVRGLRKAKAKYMVDALMHGIYEGGNHFMTCYGNIYHFFYRGTVIYKWDAVNNQHTEVDAKEFEGTMSTRNQRREIKKSIENFNIVVFGL